MSHVALPSEKAYALGHDDRELNRLARQAELVSPITRRIFERAGLSPGMRVLDVGSGLGSVSFLAADIVGTSGSVVGIDLSEKAVSSASRLADQRGYTNVRFIAGDAQSLSFTETFDALVGRYVLLFLSDPAGTLASLTRHLHSGSLIAFHEPAMDDVRPHQDSAAFQTCSTLVARALAATGADVGVGMKLHRIFIAAGFPPPAMSLEAVIGAGPDALAWPMMMCDLLETLAPTVLEHDLSGGAPVDVDGLRAAMTQEIGKAGAVYVGRSEVGAWSRRI